MQITMLMMDTTITFIMLETVIRKSITRMNSSKLNALLAFTETMMEAVVAVAMVTIMVVATVMINAKVIIPMETAILVEAVTMDKDPMVAQVSNTLNSTTVPVLSNMDSTTVPIPKPMLDVVALQLVTLLDAIPTPMAVVLIQAVDTIRTTVPITNTNNKVTLSSNSSRMDITFTITIRTLNLSSKTTIGIRMKMDTLLATLMDIRMMNLKPRMDIGWIPYIGYTGSY